MRGHDLVNPGALSIVIRWLAYIFESEWFHPKNGCLCLEGATETLTAEVGERSVNPRHRRD
jgi:hypothetical protein